jgi:ribonuclease HI
VKLAEHNRIELVWVLGHVGTDGNETADQLARQVSTIPLTGPEPSLGTYAKDVRGLTRD